MYVYSVWFGCMREREKQMKKRKERKKGRGGVMLCLARYKKKSIRLRELSMSCFVVPALMEGEPGPGLGSFHHPVPSGIKTLFVRASVL